MTRSLLVLFVAGLLQAADPRAVIVIRHAERAGGTAADVGISETGRCRAEGLARMLTDSGVTQIYTSEVARTQQTAEPLAKKLAIRPNIIAANNVSGLVSKLRAPESHGTALV